VNSCFRCKCLREAYHFALSVEAMKRDDGARELWRTLYAELAEGESGLVGAVTSRAEAQIVRLSVLYALLDKSDVIRVEHLKAAAALWDYAAQSARYIFGSSAGTSLGDRVLKVLRDRGELPTTEIHRLLGNHVRADHLKTTLVDLQQAGRAGFRQVPTGGRPAELWHAVA
jgi:hypothetical protein